MFPERHNAELVDDVRVETIGGKGVVLLIGLRTAASLVRTYRVSVMTVRQRLAEIAA